jgi:hypothetical protein
LGLQSCTSRESAVEKSKDLVHSGQFLDGDNDGRREDAFIVYLEPKEGSVSAVICRIAY